MLSKSSKWELGFVHYISKFTILRFIISRFECIYFFFWCKSHNIFWTRGLLHTIQLTYTIEERITLVSSDCPDHLTHQVWVIKIGPKNFSFTTTAFRMNPTFLSFFISGAKITKVKCSSSSRNFIFVKQFRHMTRQHLIEFFVV